MTIASIGARFESELSHGTRVALELNHPRVSHLSNRRMR